MHFPIICIENMATPKEYWHEPDREDFCLNKHIDYYGEQYSAEERKDVITSGWLERLFDGIATVDSDAETLTFKDAKTIRFTIQDWFTDETERLHKMAVAGRLNAFDLRTAGEEFRGCLTLFYNCMEDTGCCYGLTSMDFVEDAKYFAGKTVAIGNIFDAHI